jgi:hypothetical protein
MGYINIMLNDDALYLFFFRFYYFLSFVLHEKLLVPYTTTGEFSKNNILSHTSNNIEIATKLWQKGFQNMCSFSIFIFQIVFILNC